MWLTGAALIAKTFYQRLADCTEDSAISVALERELEEVLLGRPELAVMASGSYVDPRQPTRAISAEAAVLERRNDSYWTIGMAVTFESQLARWFVTVDSGRRWLAGGMEAE